MRTIDLSCDLGEAADPAHQVVEDAVWPLITSANVACGGHAGDESTMRHAVDQSRRFGVRLGAHPSYPDRENFGRRSMRLPPNKLRQSLIDQMRMLADLAGERLTHVKPHGALYNDAHHDSELAARIAEAINEFDREIALVAAPGSELLKAAAANRLAVIPEAFADRRYRLDGSLVPRSRDDALLLDFEEAAAQAVSLALSNSVTADDGTTVRINFETLCIHGDMDFAAARLERIRQRLSATGIFEAPRRITPFQIARAATVQRLLVAGRHSTQKTSDFTAVPQRVQRSTSQQTQRVPAPCE